jgi:hypothetical protein
MICKSTIATIALTVLGLASPAFAQAPPTYDYGYPGAYVYLYDQSGPYGWAPDSYSGWPTAASIQYNIHTPPNH